MTDLVSLLFIAMIPIDFEITNVSLQLFAYFFVKIIIFGKLTSATYNERMTTDIVLRVPHPLINKKVHMPVSFVFAFACPVAQRYTQRRA